jgi:hypothetical protein
MNLLLGMSCVRRRRKKAAVTSLGAGPPGMNALGASGLV